MPKLFGDDGGSWEYQLLFQESFISNVKSWACQFCDILDKDGGHIDNPCSDIPKFPICPGFWASALLLPALASPSFLSNLIHHGNCQLGAFEAWGLQKMF